MYPDDRKYTREHEWVQLAGGEARVGITEYAQRQLGDIVYLDLPEVGRTVRQGEAFGSVESVKAVSELFAPVSGEIVEVNSELAQRPERVNADPHGSWMVVLKTSGPGDGLLDASEYADLAK